MTIWLDMDGTCVNLYGVNNWLEKLKMFDESPYKEAKPIVNMNALARILNNRQKRGYKIGIISLLAKNSNEDYDRRVMNAKREWLNKHLASVQFDEIIFKPYDFIKNNVNNGNDILVDDEERHLTAWTGYRIEAQNIIKELRAL